MKKTIIILILLPSIIFANGNVFDKMDEAAIKATGISKLTQQEQNALLKWLKSSKKEIIKKEKVKNMGLVEKATDRQAIHSSIVGEFNGWRGKNIFKLDNGQVWKQTENTTFYVPKRSNPDITIKPKSMGTWQLYLDGFGRGVKVKRIK